MCRFQCKCIHFCHLWKYRLFKSSKSRSPFSLRYHQASFQRFSILFIKCASKDLGVLTQWQLSLLYSILWLIVTLLLIEVAIGCDRKRPVFSQRFFALCTRKLPFDSELEFAVCDSAIWFMLFPMPLRGSVLSFPLQKHSLWEFYWHLKKYPASHWHPTLPQQLSALLYNKNLSSGLSFECVCMCFHAVSSWIFHSQFLSTILGDSNLI